MDREKSRSVDRFTNNFELQLKYLCQSDAVRVYQVQNSSVDEEAEYLIQGIDPGRQAPCPRVLWHTYCRGI